jgi:hypothetical protein
MKIFKLLFGLAFFIMLSIPQTSSAQARLRVNDSFISYDALTAADTINGTAETGKWFAIDEPKDYNYLVQANAHNVAHVGNVLFYLYGSNTGASTDWKLLQTVTWKVTTADTCVYFDSGTTKVRWKYLKPTIKGASSGNRTRLTKSNVKIGY